MRDCGTIGIVAQCFYIDQQIRYRQRIHEYGNDRASDDTGHSTDLVISMNKAWACDQPIHSGPEIGSPMDDLQEVWKPKWRKYVTCMLDVTLTHCFPLMYPENMKNPEETDYLHNAECQCYYCHGFENWSNQRKETQITTVQHHTYKELSPYIIVRIYRQDCTRENISHILYPTDYWEKVNQVGMVPSDSELYLCQGSQYCYIITDENTHQIAFVRAPRCKMEVSREQRQ